MNADEEIKEQGRRIGRLFDDARVVRNSESRRENRLDSIQEEVRQLALDAEILIELPQRKSPHISGNAGVPNDLLAAMGSLDEATIKRLHKEFFHSIPSVPPLDSLDMFVIVTVGCLAALTDFVMVGLPPPTKWTPRVNGGIVPEGLITSMMKKWTVDNDNWLARLCGVPFDRPTIPGTDYGLSPVNHRVLTIGHDPSPMGFVFGLIDIVAGSMTGVTYDGRLFSIPGVPASWTRVSLAPLIWIGHLLSDVATPMGLPVPGSSLLQLLRIGVPGAPDNATVADVARIMYQQGYDFRHYLSGGVVPGLIEGLIRLYDWLRDSDGRSHGHRGAIQARLAETSVMKTTSDARLASRLFWCHAIATGANAGRVALQGSTGNFFHAVRGINLAQWQVFSLRSVQYVHALLRDTSLDQALHNRRKLEARWDILLSSDSAMRVFYEKRSISVESERVVL